MYLLEANPFIYLFFVYVHMFGLGTELQFQNSKQVIWNKAKQASTSTYSKAELSKLWAAVPGGPQMYCGGAIAKAESNKTYIKCIFSWYLYRTYQNLFLLLLLYQGEMHCLFLTVFS